MEKKVGLLSNAEIEYASAFMAVKEAFGDQPDLWMRVDGRIEKADATTRVHSVYLAGLLAFEVDLKRGFGRNTGGLCYG